jgi:hypothetical protein
MNISRVFAAILLVASALFSAACSSSGGAPQPSSEEGTGTISVALTAIGPDGATYGFTPTSYLTVGAMTDGGNFNQALMFNTTSASQSFSVPPGIYSAALYATLQRLGDAGPTNVNAVLTDHQPYQFTVAAGQTVPLTFHFTIPVFGAVTFSNGTLTTNLQVDSGLAQPTHAQASAALSVTMSGNNGPTALNNALATAAPVAINYSVTLTMTGAVHAQLDSACFNVSATVTASSDTSGNDPNVAAFFNELSGGTGSLCFYDANSSTNPGQVSLSLARFGAAQTPQMIAALGSTALANEGFEAVINAVPPAPFYDGTTLNVSALSQPITMTGQSTTLYYEPNNTMESTYNGQVGTFTLQLLP